MTDETLRLYFASYIPSYLSSDGEVKAKQLAGEKAFVKCYREAP